MKVLFLGGCEKTIRQLQALCNLRNLKLEYSANPKELTAVKLSEYRVIVSKFKQDGAEKSGYQLYRELVEHFPQLFERHTLRRKPKIPMVLIHEQNRLGIVGYCHAYGIVPVGKLLEVGQYLN